jgi:phage shock protein A
MSGPQPLTPDEEQELRKLSLEQLVYGRGKFQGYMDDAANAVKHYRDRYEATKTEIRKRKKKLEQEGVEWNEEAIKQNIDKLIVLAKAGVGSIEELLALQAKGVDVENYEAPEQVVSKPFEPEKPPTIIVPDQKDIT